MHFFRQVLLLLTLTFTSFFVVGCGGGEADYSTDQVIAAQKLANVEDLIKGNIDFITKDNMYVDQTGGVVTTIKADTTENLLYSIVGGADSSLFKVDERTGEVSFITTPVYDPNGSNAYEVIIGAKTPSGELSTLHMTVTVVENINTIAPIIDLVVTNIDAISSSDVITQIQARPAKESDYLRFNVVGQDANSFSIDNDGNLVFTTPLPDFGSTPNRVYTIAIEVTDGNGNVTTTAPITITLVGDRDQIRPVIESSSFNVVENALGNMQIEVSTEGTGVVTTYTLNGGDASEFSVDNSGVIKFNVAKDFELNKNSYNITVQVQDDKGNVSDLKPITISVVDIDEGYTFESIANVTVLSGTQTITKVTATSNVLTDITRKYLLNNYQDVFAIDNNGNLTFVSPAVAGRSYDVTIVAQSYISGTEDLINGSQTISPSFTVSVVQNPSLIAPIISAGYVTSTSVTAPIDTATPITTVDASFGAGSDASSLSYKTVGEDADLFAVDSNGVLTFKSVINYVVDGDNTYNVSVEVKDNNGNVTTTSVITVELLQDPREIAPIINVTTYTTPENILGDMYIETLITEGGGSISSYTIVGGADSGLFDLDSVTGQLKFITKPDYESTSHSNIYQVEVTATDSNANVSDKKLLTITVEDVNEKLSFTSLQQFTSVENSPLVATISATSTVLDSVVSYSVNSTDFKIDAQSGALHFIADTTPTYNTIDSNANSYSVQVTAVSQYNGSLAVSPVITVTVLPQDRSISWSVTAADLSIFNPDGSVYLNEKSTTDINVIATSSVNPSMLYTIECDSISTCNVDVNTPIFSINPNNGVMTINAPSYIYSANPEDNTYRATVFVVADDGFDTRDSIAGVMHVNYLDGTPTFISNATFTIEENSKAIGTVQATLPAIVNSTLKYAIDGGADATLFRIDAVTGELSFWNAEDYENPTNSNNSYEVIVRATDVKVENTLNTATQVVTVNVEDVVITFDNNTVSETASDGYRSWRVFYWKYYITTTELQVTAAPIAGSGSWSYSIISNPDPSIFSMSSTGLLRVDAPRYSSDTLFALQIQAIDGNGLTRTDWMYVTILDD